MDEFPVMKMKQTYWFEDREYIKIKKSDGFTDPEAQRFLVGSRVMWFKPKPESDK